MLGFEVVAEFYRVVTSAPTNSRFNLLKREFNKVLYGLVDDSHPSLFLVQLVNAQRHLLIQAGLNETIIQSLIISLSTSTTELIGLIKDNCQFDQTEDLNEHDISAFIDILISAREIHPKSLQTQIVEQHLRQGDLSFLNKDYKAAASSYRSAKAADATSFIAAERLRQAISRLIEQAIQDKNQVQIIAYGELALAEKVDNEIIIGNLGNAYYYQANYYLHSGYYQLALDYFDLASTVFPTDPKIMEKVVITMGKILCTDVVQEILLKYIYRELTLIDPELAINLAAVFAKSAKWFEDSGQLESAVHCYLQANKLAPSDPYPQRQLVRLCCKLVANSNDAKHVMDWLEVARKVTVDQEAISTLADYYSSIGYRFRHDDFQTAISLCLKAVELNPKDLQNKVDLGEVYLERVLVEPDLNLALQYLDTALEIPETREICSMMLSALDYVIDRLKDVGNTNAAIHYCKISINYFGYYFTDNSQQLDPKELTVYRLQYIDFLSEIALNYCHEKNFTAANDLLVVANAETNKLTSRGPTDSSYLAAILVYKYVLAEKLYLENKLDIAVPPLQEIMTLTERVTEPLNDRLAMIRQLSLSRLREIVLRVPNEGSHSSETHKRRRDDDSSELDENNTPERPSTPVATRSQPFNSSIIASPCAAEEYPLSPLKRQSP